jgi:hypothetical protein
MAFSAAQSRHELGKTLGRKREASRRRPYSRYRSSGREHASALAPRHSIEQMVGQTAFYLLAIFCARKTPMTLPMKLPPTTRTMKGQKLLVSIPISLQTAKPVEITSAPPMPLARGCFGRCGFGLPGSSVMVILRLDVSLSLLFGFQAMSAWFVVLLVQGAFRRPITPRV